MTEHDTKKCPHCGEEIKAQAIKCKHCRKFINDAENNIEQTEITEINEKHDNKALTFVCVGLLFVILSAGAICLAQYNTSNAALPRHELVAPASSSLTMKEAIEQITIQDTAIREVLSKNLSDKDKDKAFSEYLDNIQYYVDVINNKYFYEGTYFDELQKLYNNRRIYIQGIEIIPAHENYKEYFCGKINSPKVDTIGVEYGGEGTYNVFINYQYLYDSFSGVLSLAFKDYLRLTKEMYNTGGIESAKLDEFRERYPNFIRKSF